MDPDVQVIARVTVDDQPVVEYQRMSTFERWRVTGTCNQCGLCVIGAAMTMHYAWDGPPGTPYAVRDLRYGQRPDEPVVPGFAEDMEEMARQTPTATVSGCSLTIEAL